MYEETQMGLLDVTILVSTASCSISSSIIGMASEHLATCTCTLDSTNTCSESLIPSSETSISSSMGELDSTNAS